MKFEFEVREGAMVPHSLSFEHLYNLQAILSRYPKVEVDHLEQNIYKMVTSRIDEYLIQNGYRNEESDKDETD